MAVLPGPRVPQERATSKEQSTEAAQSDRHPSIVPPRPLWRANNDPYGEARQGSYYTLQERLPPPPPQCRVFYTRCSYIIPAYILLELENGILSSNGTDAIGQRGEGLASILRYITIPARTHLTGDLFLVPGNHSGLFAPLRPLCARASVAAPHGQTRAVTAEPSHLKNRTTT